MDIKLVEITKDDIDLIRNWRNSEEVSSYMYSEEKITKQQQEQWFNKIKKATNSKYWIITYNEKKLGLVSLTDINKTLNSCYWAFYLGDTSVRGAGIGAKVEYTILNYVFENHHLHILRLIKLSKSILILFVSLFISLS